MSKSVWVIVAVLILGANGVGAVGAEPLSSMHPPAHRGEYARVARRVTARALRGDPDAQARLGFMYANGRGVAQSDDTAVDWYIRGAEQGDPTAQYLLGLMYDKGFGVDQNVVLAYKWLNLAAAHAPRRSHEYYERLREAVASKMTRDQIALGQQMAIDFVPVRAR